MRSKTVQNGSIQQKKPDKSRLVVSILNLKKIRSIEPTSAAWGGLLDNATARLATHRSSNGRSRNHDRS